MSARKTVSLRLDPSLHDRATLVARVHGKTVTEVMTAALEQYVRSAMTNANFRRLAESVLSDMDAETARLRSVVEA